MKNVVLIKHPKNWGLSELIVTELAVNAMRLRNLGGVELSLVFVGRKVARDLNIKYRQKSYIPQVLEFPMSSNRDTDGWIRLGDIVICTNKLKYEAKYFKKNINEVLEEWVNHGLSNLLI